LPVVAEVPEALVDNQEVELELEMEDKEQTETVHLLTVEAVVEVVIIHLRLVELDLVDLV
tara:strand:+ start:339 stop:518 length:180 start_codon:yes stop_codon:yes gene_type:complete